jgi:D-lactate dehydrogenase
MGKRKELATSLPEIIHLLCQKAHIELHIPDATGHCCGMMWVSKGIYEAESMVIEKLYYFLKKESDNFRVPVLIDSSSCFTHLLESLLDFHKNQHAQYNSPQFLDISDFLMNYVAPKLPPKKKHSKIALHIPCSLIKSSHSETMLNIAKEYADEVVIPEFSGCCGFAGDKGFSVPELNKSATKRSKSELISMEFDGYYSSNTTCEIGMSDDSMTFRSLAYLLYETT